ncbi:MAG: type II/IV secretion system ATPase subunit, partial [Candidatus Heimdallarchaeota archaeon]|nr:type II/IV secretion system ATPase subunit [Candidatus Heimdallarchaeota archaeon]
MQNRVVFLKKKERNNHQRKKDWDKLQKKSDNTLPPSITNDDFNYDDNSTLNWNKLTKNEVVFDDERKEYVYQIHEPVLSNEDETLMHTLMRIFRIQTEVDVYDIDEDKKIEQLTEKLEKIIKIHRITIPSEVKEKIFYYLIRTFIGYGKIDVLMHDDEIEDISCDGCNVPIFIYHRNYESIRTNIIYESEEELNAFVVKLSQICGKQISIYEPIIDGKLPDGSRLQAILGKTVTKSSIFTIRRFRENPLTPIDLIDNNTLSLDMVAYFWLIMDYGASILFCGGTASGKTTMLNALSLFIPASYKIVSVEDTREINLPHENWIAGTARTGFSTSEKEKTTKDIDMFDLMKAALRQRPRIIIVGEVRGKEAYTLFQAMATGHGGFSSIHADSVDATLTRLTSTPMDVPKALISNSLDIITLQ